MFAMNRRANRRWHAIIGVLARRGPLTETSICLELHYRLGLLASDLMWMEHNGWVRSEWGSSAGPDVRVYRLPNGDGNG